MGHYEPKNQDIVGKLKFDTHIANERVIQFF